MELIRYGNDINITWSVFGRNESPYSISGRVYRLWLINGSGKKEITSYTIQARNQLVFLIDDTELNRLGSYKLELQLREPGAQGATYDLTQVFQIVSATYPRPTATSINGVCDIAFRSVLKNVYVSELEGASAYEIARQNGFIGSQSDWLRSLIGLRSIDQVVSSSESGGRNVIRFTLADGSIHDIDIYNGGRGASGMSYLRDLSDVTLSEPISYGDLLRYNGAKWTNIGGLDYTYGEGIKISEERVISADIGEIAAGLIAAGYSLSPGGEGASSLSSLSDVTLTTPTEGQVLTYDSLVGKWVARNPTGGSGGGSSTLSGLTDVFISQESLSEDMVLAYSLDADGDGNPGWKPIAISGGTPISDYVTLTTQQTISGAKTFSSALTASSSLAVGTTITSGGAITSNGALTVGNGSSSGSDTTRRVYFKDTYHYIELDSNNNFKFVGGGIYTESFVSAGGQSSGGSGGGGGDLPDASNGMYLKYNGGIWDGAYIVASDLNHISASEGYVIRKGQSSWEAAQLELDDLKGVDTSNKQANYYLKYVVNNGVGSWIADALPAGLTPENPALYFGSPIEATSYGTIKITDGTKTYNVFASGISNSISFLETQSEDTIGLRINGTTKILRLGNSSSGGGDTISFTERLTTGTRIAKVQIGSESPFYLYAPTGSSGTIPTELPNPYALQFGSNGAQYDGSSAFLVDANDITNSLGYTPLQQSAIADMATKTWVGQQGFAKTTEVATTLSNYVTNSALAYALEDYLPLIAGSDYPLTGNLYSPGLRPTTSYSVSGVTRNGNDVGGYDDDGEEDGTLLWYRDAYIKRYYFYKHPTNANNDVYMEYDSTAGCVKLHGSFAATGNVAAGS